MVISYWDAVIAPVYIIILVMIANSIRIRKVHLQPEYKYFTWGLVAKMFGAIAVCLIYTFYYDGGDTVNYFTSTQAFANLMEKDFSSFMKAMFDAQTQENYSLFDSNTGYPLYWWDARSTMVSKLLVPVYYLGMKSFVASAIVLASICFSGIWRLYLLFCSIFPRIKDQLAVSILFIPSVVFWGSGMLKDTITIGAVGWYAYSFYWFFMKGKYTPGNSAAIILSSYLLIAIKPYIFFALMPGSIVWLSNDRLSRIRNRFLRVVAAPMLIVAGLGGGFYLLTQMSEYLGVYAVDNILNRAVEVQSDLKKDYYGGNTFDIGEFNSDISSMLGVSHKAIEAALFRPYIWEVKNIVMFISALENTFILLFSLFLLLRMRILGFFFYIWKNPMLLFSVMFSLFFAFSVGISTPNFGSLVRLKIPCIPFYISSLVVLNYYYRDKRVSFRGERD
jgi:hypothetical protein